ncbi:16 kDa proteolipid subunit 2 [Seminavis robusta]|uniref:16 kDa proteolipid subunit 2 n=1 Tax=Seminavis robusta TaxID=568900 RepID=A0A9N8EA88_9STRA|nr:16 kDa proteolipid subunit 2 [Seminavis robusta]|eukprot:Sro801_g204480.1 16 kDa proteolipid subunit 2 (179) ;mRNA; f:26165-26701
MDPALLTGLGAASAIFLTAIGSAIATSHAGIFALRGNSWMNFVPVVQAGVLSVYGIIIGCLLCFKLDSGKELSQVEGYRNLSAGLAVGLACWASGYGMMSFLQQINDGKAGVGDSKPGDGSSRTVSSDAAPEREPLLPPPQTGGQASPLFFKKFVLVMIFLESVGLYGLIVALFLVGK